MIKISFEHAPGGNDRFELKLCSLALLLHFTKMRSTWTASVIDRSGYQLWTQRTCLLDSQCRNKNYFRKKLSEDGSFWGKRAVCLSGPVQPKTKTASCWFFFQKCVCSWVCVLQIQSVACARHEMSVSRSMCKIWEPWTKANANTANSAFMDVLVVWQFKVQLTQQPQSFREAFST